MPCTSIALSNGDPQNVHGPNPSLTHITFPQLKQFGAAASKGWRAPIQLHFRFSLSICKELFVEISRLRIAASSSLITEEAPCMDVPPVILTFVLDGAGEEVREAFLEEELLLDLKSEIRAPAAEGGGLGIGAWMASGLGLRVKALLAVDDEAVAFGRFAM
jgi:hypothetical protein